MKCNVCNENIKPDWLSVQTNPDINICVDCEEEAMLEDTYVDDEPPTIEGGSNYST